MQDYKGKNLEEIHIAARAHLILTKTPKLWLQSPVGDYDSALMFGASLTTRCSSFCIFKVDCFSDIGIFVSSREQSTLGPITK